MREQIRDIIGAHGQFVQRVNRSLGDPPGFLPFIYTIGNHERALPELLVVGLTADAFIDLLNRLGKIQRERASSLRPGEIVSVGGKFPVRIGDGGKNARKEYAVQVGVFYRTDNFQVRQVLIPDQDGRWPDDPACKLPYSLQPLLFSPS